MATHRLSPRVPEWIGAGDFVYRTEPVPVFVSAHGSRLTDREGRTYVDAEAANGTVALGYDADLARGAAEAVSALPSLPSFCESTLRLEVAELLARRISAAAGTPGRVSFEVGGAQGIELALKIVAANVGAGQIITFQGAYHGRSPFTAHLSSSVRYRSLLGGSQDVVRIPYPDPAQSPFGLPGDASAEAALAFVRTLGEEYSGVRAGHVAALIVEPILNVGGMARPDGEFLRGVVEHCRRLGALVVVDEVFTGFHRTGPQFGFELHGVQPDLVVVSKALTNGIAPMSAVWAREPLLDAANFAPGSHSSTLSGTPFVLAVARSVLDRFSDAPAWQRRLAALELALGEIVAGIVADHPTVVASGYAQGGVARLLLNGPWAAEIRRSALAPRRAVGDGVDGLLIASTGMAPNVIALHPPLVISDEDLAVTDAHLRAAIGDIAIA